MCNVVKTRNTSLIQMLAATAVNPTVVPCCIPLSVCSGDHIRYSHKGKVVAPKTGGRADGYWRLFRFEVRNGRDEQHWKQDRRKMLVPAGEEK